MTILGSKSIISPFLKIEALLLVPVRFFCYLYIMLFIYLLFGKILFQASFVKFETMTFYE